MSRETSLSLTAGLGREAAWRRVPWLRAMAGAAAVIAGLAGLARGPRPASDHVAAPLSVAPARLVAPPPRWTSLDDASPSFAVEAAELKGLQRRFEARLDAAGRREDKLVFGVFESEDPYLRLTLYRGAPPAASFYLDLVRRAGEAGLGVLKSAQAVAVSTKFGPAEVAQVVLADSIERACLAFRFQAERVLAVHGWYCAPPERPLPWEGLVCLIDGLALLPAAGSADPALIGLFALADQHRPEACRPLAPPPKRRRA